MPTPIIFYGDLPFLDSLIEDSMVLDSHSKTLYADMNRHLTYEEKLDVRETALHMRVSARLLEQATKMAQAQYDAMPRWKKYILSKIL